MGPVVWMNTCGMDERIADWNGYPYYVPNSMYSLLLIYLLHFMICPFFTPLFAGVYYTERVH